MLFREVITIYSENHSKFIHTKCKVVDYKTSSTYSATKLEVVNTEILNGTLSYVPSGPSDLRY
jgi:hypothetical protein